MPVVITDYTNKVWAVEQPGDGLVHVGWSGKPGPKLIDVLEFISSRQKQFDAFVNKKHVEEVASGKKTTRIRRDPGIALRSTEDLRPTEG